MPSPNNHRHETPTAAAENLVGSAAGRHRHRCRSEALPAATGRGAGAGGRHGRRHRHVGTSNAAYAGAEAQRRYDIAYQRCMYAKGNQLPGSGYGGTGRPPPAGPLSLSATASAALALGPAALRVTSPAPWGTIPAQEIKP